jgi:transcriptional regulator with XRE-family HTH domain
MLVNFKTALAARKIHQADLARSLQIAPTVLSEIIHERRHADASLRARIATALRANETWLFSTAARIPGPTSFGNPEAPQPTFACAGKEV